MQLDSISFWALKGTYYENNTFPGIWVVLGLWCSNKHKNVEKNLYMKTSLTCCGRTRGVRHSLYDSISSEAHIAFGRDIILLLYKYLYIK